MMWSLLKENSSRRGIVHVQYNTKSKSEKKQIASIVIELRDKNIYEIRWRYIMVYVGTHLFPQYFHNASL